MIYGDALPTFAPVISEGNFVNGETWLNTTLATAATSTSNVGNYAITRGDLAASANYNVVYTDGTLKIDPRTIKVNGGTASMTYGDALPTFAPVISEGNFVNGDNWLNTTLATAATSASNIGDYAITRGDLAASANYNVVYTNGTLSIGKRTITVNGGTPSMIYGDAVPTLAPVIAAGNFVNGDNWLNTTLATTATSASNIGNYAVTRGDLAASANYNIIYTNGTLSIGRRIMTVTANAQEIYYGDAPTLTYTIGGKGLAALDSLTGALETGATSTSNIGTYDITQGTLAIKRGAVDMGNNYNLTINTDAKVTITKRPITITADAITMIYGNNVPNLTATIGDRGLVNNDMLTDGLQTDASSAANVGDYNITQGVFAIKRGGVDVTANYTITNVNTNAKVSIGKRTLTIVGNNQTITYGNSVPTLGYEFGGMGLAALDSFNGALALATTGKLNAGDHSIVQGTLAVMRGTVDMKDNYSISYRPGTLTVDKRPVTVTARAITMNYGDAVPALGFDTTLTNPSTGGDAIINGDSLTVALSTLAGPNSNKGTYAITTSNDYNTANPNYAITFVGNNVKVEPRPVNVTAFSYEIYYGNGVPTLSSVVTDQDGTSCDPVCPTQLMPLATLATNQSNVGDYSITLGSLPQDSNYRVNSYTPGIVKVKQRPITISAIANSMTYGGAVPTLTYNKALTATTPTVSGTVLVNGDSFAGALAATATSASDAGSNYQIQQGSLGVQDKFGNASGNYAVTYVGAQFTVNKRILTITAKPSQGMVYGDTVPQLGYDSSIQTLYNGDTLMGSLATTASNTADTGNYPITLGTLKVYRNPAQYPVPTESPNYTIDLAGDTVFTIAHRPITVTAVAPAMSYGDAVPELTWTVGDRGLVNQDKLTGALVAVKRNTPGPGIYDINVGTLSAPTNYAMTFTGNTIVVGKRTVILSAKGVSVPYGDAIPTLSVDVIRPGYSGSGLINEGDLTGALSTAAATGSNVGTYIINQGTLSLPSDYYNFTYQANDVNILPRKITVTAADKSITYGDNVPTLSYAVALTDPAVSGDALVNMDTLSVGLATTATPTSNVGQYNITKANLTIKRGALDTSGNYEVIYNTGVLNVDRRKVTVAANSNQSMIYGDAVPTLSYTVKALDGQEGYVNGDTQLTGKLETAATQSSDAGDYAITRGSLGITGNYEVTNFTGNTLKINPRTIKVNGGTPSMTYGDALPTLAPVISEGNFLTGQTWLNTTLATAATSTSNVGTYAITQGGLAASSNYNIIYTNGALEIKQRPITVTAKGIDMIYGNNVPELPSTIGGRGLVNNDKLFGGLQTVASSTSNVGDYNITQGDFAIKRDNLDVSSNYHVVFNTNAKVSIGKRALTIAANEQEITYGESLPTFDFTLGGEGLASGDTKSSVLSGALSTTAGDAPHAGTYTIGQGTLSASSNYKVIFSGNKFTVKQRALTIAANSKTMTYGDTVPTLTYVIGGRGLVGSDALSGALTTVASSTSNVGTYAIERGSLSASSDYAVTYAGNTITVGQRKITVAADNKTMTSGSALPAFTYGFTLGQLVNGDLLKGGLATSANASSPAGLYTIGQGSLSASNNYDLHFVTGALTIDAVGNQPPEIVGNVPVAPKAIQAIVEQPVTIAKMPEVKIETTSCTSSGSSSGDFVDLVSGMSVAGQMALGGCSAAN